MSTTATHHGHAPAPPARGTTRGLGVVVAAAVLALATALLVMPRTAPVATRTSGDRALAERVVGMLPDGQRTGGSVGVAVAALDHGRLTQAGIGTLDGTAPVRPDSVFETGSVQKILTATLLAELVHAERIALSDTLGDLWPGTGFRDPDVAAVTVGQLATHTAGLPSFPVREDRGFPVALAGYLLGGNAYAALGDPIEAVARMSGYAPGPHGYSYSNLGYAVLGETLAEVAGHDYATALTEYVLRPLAMPSTTVRTDPGVPAGAAHPYRSAGVPTVPWTNPRWAAVGTGTWTSTTDLITLLRAFMRTDDPALRLTRTPYATGPYAPAHDSATGLAWQIWTVAGAKIFWHNGLTNGSRTFMAHTDDDRAVVVLANSTDTPVEEIGMALLGVTAAEFDEPQSPHPALLMVTVTLALGGGALALLGIVGPRRGRLSRPLDRLAVISLLLTGTAVWVFALRVGEWGYIHHIVWPLGAALLAAAAVFAFRRWPHLPTTRGTRSWLRWLTFTPAALLASLLLVADLLVLAQLP